MKTIPAVVKPRVHCPNGGAVLPLRDVVADLLEEPRCRVLAITGPSLSGKTTALRDLAHAFRDHDRVAFLDEPTVDSIEEANRDRVVIYTRCEVWSHSRPQTVLRLASWGDDDLIEYLLAAHRADTASVMVRVMDDDERTTLDGLPGLWAPVLDRMVREPSIRQARVALMRCLQKRLADELASARGWCLAFIEAGSPEELNQPPSEDPWCRSVIRRTAEQRDLAAEHLAGELAARRGEGSLTSALPVELIALTGRRVRGDDRALRYLDTIIRRRTRDLHPVAAGILLAADPDWRPTGRPPFLSGAYLPHTRWRGLDLTGVSLKDAVLSEADLGECTLKKASLAHACLQRARLDGAMLYGANLTGADLHGADLTFVRGLRTVFAATDLQFADLSHGFLRLADFNGADLHCTSFRHADVGGASFLGVTLDTTDFSNACLRKAVFEGAILRTCLLGGVDFSGAVLRRCDLEYVSLPGARFGGASLDGSDLTGSWMPGARFGRASLRKTGLADVDWERADLRRADLRGATFHMGSSRSGLVDSPIASEGSRTGFYTDDYFDQSFVAPEAVRKANLRGADLRGARLEGVDFYLVDLRDAHLDPDAIEHARRTGAILESRVAE